ncbi:MAG: c-type cytochrome biogenesis protein CcmI, partial [Colwellia sp.]|nr:c-type cytochrome biogenesis protein CcmI [Colwellia sp.]
QPSATQPSATQPSATQPSATQPSATQHSATQPTKKPQPINVLWPIALSLFIVTFSVVIYLQQGTFDKLMATPTSHVTQQGQMSVEQQEQARQEQMLGYINKLQQHVKGSPDDREAWYNLGQTYVGAGEFDFAIAAFNQVMRIEGEHADILGAIAQASYYRNNQQIDEQVQALIDKALALDNNDPATNILLGMHNFIVQNYVTAIEHWQRVIDTNRQGVNITALKEAVVEAKNRLGMSSAEQSTGQLPVGPQLQVSVSLSADIAKQLAQEEDKVVFVYAIPTDGKRMPLAALKLKASDLPKVIILSNNNAMSPQNNLSSVSKVHVYAVVSKQGGAGIKPGDFKAEVHDILVNSTDIIELVIDKLVE